MDCALYLQPLGMATVQQWGQRVSNSRSSARLYISSGSAVNTGWLAVWVVRLSVGGPMGLQLHPPPTSLPAWALASSVMAVAEILGQRVGCRCC